MIQTDFLHDVAAARRKSFGNADVPFCMQSCVKPLNYALAVTELGTRRVHEFVGREPSGVSFDEIALDPSSERYVIISTERKQKITGPQE